MFNVRGVFLCVVLVNHLLTSWRNACPISFEVNSQQHVFPKDQLSWTGFQHCVASTSNGLRHSWKNMPKWVIFVEFLIFKFKFPKTVSSGLMNSFCCTVSLRVKWCFGFLCHVMIFDSLLQSFSEFTAVVHSHMIWMWVSTWPFSTEHIHCWTGFFVWTLLCFKSSCCRIHHGQNMKFVRLAG